MIKFEDFSSLLGSHIEPNESIQELVGWSANEIIAKTGIKQRFISAESESAESLALGALQNINKEHLSNSDLIVSVSNTQMHDFPTIAHFVHSELKLKESIKCIGINAGCTGFVDAIELVYSYFQSGFSSKAIIINSDTYSKYLGNERSTRTLFSDGALVTVVSKDENGFKITEKVSSSAASTYYHLIKRDHEGFRTIKMNGPKVLQFAMSTVVRDLSRIIDNNKGDYILFPHQAGKIILETLKRKLSENVKVIENYSNYGNLVSASIPNLIRENIELLSAKKIILSGFGVGLSHNAILLERGLKN